MGWLWEALGAGVGFSIVPCPADSEAECTCPGELQGAPGRLDPLVPLPETLPTSLCSPPRPGPRNPGT